MKERGGDEVISLYKTKPGRLGPAVGEELRKGSKKIILSFYTLPFQKKKKEWIEVYYAWK